MVDCIDSDWLRVYGLGLVIFVSYTVTLNHFLEQAVYPPGLLDAEDAVIVT